MNKRQLTRDMHNRKISGVCAGIANYFDIETWIVRIAFVSAFLLGGGPLVIFGYFGLAFMLEKKPVARVGHKAEPKTEPPRQPREHKLKENVWERGQTPGEMLSTLEREFDGFERTLRKMEAHVTSDSFQVNRQFKEL